MASSVSNLTQYLISGVASQFAYRLAPLNAFSNVSLHDGANLNDVVRIPFVETGSASQTFAHSTGYATANSSIVGVSVTMDTWKYQLANITDSDLIRLSPEAITQLGKNLGNRLANDVLSDVLALTSSFVNHVTKSGSLWATSTAPTDLRLSGSTNRWADGDYNLIVGPQLYNKILGTTNAAAYAYGSTSAIQDAKIPRYYGFNVYECDVIPSTVKGLATTKNALGVAISYPRPQEGNLYTEVQRIVDPNSGIVLGYRKYYDNVKATMAHVFEVLYGKTILNKKGAFNVKVTDLNK